jgi:hypothetical protein
MVAGGRARSPVASSRMCRSPRDQHEQKVSRHNRAFAALCSRWVGSAVSLLRAHTHACIQTQVRGEKRESSGVTNFAGKLFEVIRPRAVEMDNKMPAAQAIAGAAASSEGHAASTPGSSSAGRVQHKPRKERSSGGMPRAEPPGLFGAGPAGVSANSSDPGQTGANDFAEKLFEVFGHQVAALARKIHAARATEVAAASSQGLAASTPGSSSAGRVQQKPRQERSSGGMPRAEPPGPFGAGNAGAMSSSGGKPRAEPPTGRSASAASTSGATPAGREQRTPCRERSSGGKPGAEPPRPFGAPDHSAGLSSPLGV